LTSDLPGAGTAGNLWRVTCRETAEAPPLEGETTADLLVVGGGFTGCAAALRAAELGARVCLIEAGTPGEGGSGRNVGLVNAGLWLPPEGVSAALGAEAGARLTQILGAAPDLVFGLIERHAIACEPVRAGTLHLAHSAAGLRDLRERHRQLAALGAPVTLLGPEETARRTGTSAYRGALHDARAGTVQPLALCLGLARAAAAAGARLHAASPALELRAAGAGVGAGWEAVTPMGRVRAGALLLATNAYHSAAAGTPAPQSVPVHYFQLATAPLPEALRAGLLPGGEGCWDTAPVMSSFRTDAAGRLVLGAIGRLDHAAGGVHRAWARRMLARLFPALAGRPLCHAWFGRIAMTGDHVPKILELGPRGLACFGYSGRGIGPGITFGTRAAEALLSNHDEALPLRPIPAHVERLAPLRAAAIETGAILAHAAGARLRPADG
jgi:glycine/D-amino acid oxidase-like deaminating enzyme